MDRARHSRRPGNRIGRGLKRAAPPNHCTNRSAASKFHMVPECVAPRPVMQSVRRIISQFYRRGDMRRHFQIGMTVTFLLFLCATPVPSTATQVAQSTPQVKELALRSRVYRNSRTIRVLLPPSYNDPAQSNHRYPVFYFADGRAAFDANGWGVPGIASQLWKEGAIPEIIFVGIDNGGSTRESKNPVLDRASEYLPYPDQTWTDSPAPTPKGYRFPTFLFEEVMTLVNRRFRTKTGPQHTGLAGDSYAGAVVLYTALKHPNRIGRLLVESPSLHIGNGRLFTDLAGSQKWPSAVYLGVGTREGETSQAQAEMVANVRNLYQEILKHVPKTRTHLVVADGGIHWFTAWRARLPEALRFLLGS